MRRLALLLPFAVMGCEQLTEQAVFSVSGTSGETTTFGVSALTGDVPPNLAVFNRVGTESAEFKARSMCTLGHEVVDERVQPFQPGQLLTRQIRCRPYVLSAPPPSF
jgi:hypothetical protein